MEKCEYCGQKLRKRQVYNKQRFCSSKCRSEKLPMPPRPDRTGSTPWNKGLTIMTDERIKRMAKNRMGIKNWSYKHGKSKSHRTQWRTAIHKAWRKSVFERDDYKCVLCGNGGELNADHINCFAHNELLRYELNNGRTLCVECHKKTKNYGVHKREDCNGKS